MLLDNSIEFKDIDEESLQDSSLEEIQLEGSHTDDVPKIRTT